MNKERRKKLKEAITYINCAVSIVDRIADEEEDSINNMPENLQGSSRYDAISNAIDDLKSAEDDLESAIEQLEDVINA